MSSRDDCPWCIDGEPFCMMPVGNFSCTREPGHTGPCVACGTSDHDLVDTAPKPTGIQLTLTIKQAVMLLDIVGHMIYFDSALTDVYEALDDHFHELSESSGTGRNSLIKKAPVDLVPGIAMTPQYYDQLEEDLKREGYL